jgi:hypothetical protein
MFDQDEGHALNKILEYSMVVYIENELLERPKENTKDHLEWLFENAEKARWASFLERFTKAIPKDEWAILLPKLPEEISHSIAEHLRDEAEQKEWADASRRSLLRWMQDNP